MAATKTRNDLITRVLGVLGKLAAGQSPDAEDAELVDGLIDPALATLAADGIAYIADPSQIDDRYFLPLAVCVADIVSPDFGAPPSPDAVFAAKSTLRRLNAGQAGYTPLKSDYF